LTPFEDGDGGGSGGTPSLTVSFGDITLADYTPPPANEFECDYLIKLNYVGTTAHTISFTLHLAQCSIAGTAGDHTFTVTGSPNLPTNGFFQVLVHSPGGFAGRITLGLYDTEQDSVTATDGNGAPIPASYGTPQTIFLNAY
jgi:hypothetical protein